MTTLTIWQFPTPDGAINAERELATLSAQDELPVNDASLVLWPENARSPQTRGAGNIAHLAPLDQSFWGLLYGHAFAAPLLCDESNEPGYLQAVGVDAEIAQVLRAGVRPGSSALLTITGQAVPVELAERIASGSARVFTTCLTAEHADNLDRVFGR